MTHVRDLTLLEKWTDASPIPAISPTSPKATTFCCCPHRRRYNLKQPKSKQHRNIFANSGFTYIDDAAQEEQQQKLQKQKQQQQNSVDNKAIYRNNDDNDYDEVDDDGYEDDDGVVGNDATQTALSEREQQQPKKEQHQPKQEQHQPNDPATNDSSDSVRGRANDDECAEERWQRRNDIASSCSSETQTQTVRQRNDVGADVDAEAPTTTTRNNCSIARAGESVGDNVVDNDSNENGDDAVKGNITTLASTELECRCDEPQQQQQPHVKQIQRLSNNCNNKENNISNSNNNKNNADNGGHMIIIAGNDKENRNNSNGEKSATHGNCCSDNSCCNRCQLRLTRKLQANGSNNNNANIANDNNRDEDEKSNDNNIDQRNKMTITTTTTVSSRKRSECGLTPTATPATTTTATPADNPTVTAATKTPATPSVTTVIKTTMVKRSPNESATTTPTTMTMASTSTNHKGSLQQHAGSSNSSCNNNSKNNKCDESTKTTTAEEPTRSVKERIAAFVAGNDQMKNHDNAFRRNQCGRGNMTANNNTSAATTTTTATPTPTTTAINGHSNSTSSAAGAAEILPPKSASNSSTPPPASVARPPANPIGSATVPRRRLLTSSALSGGNTSAAGTATTTSDEVDGVLSAEACRGRSAERKLAALDNLDLALSLELNDEDGEDPYFALQEYLERVKTEINEVFEQHKARQRLQQQQEQQHDDGATDELTRSTESDSGFDSASGNNGRPPKTSRAAVSTAATRATDETKVTEINALGRRNGQASPPVSNSSSSSNRNSNNNTQLQFDVVATTATSTDGDQTQPTTTKLHALPPPPLSPSGAAEGETNNNNGSHTSSTLQRLRKQLQAKADAAAAAVAAANNGSSASAAAADEVSIWANKFLRDLDNLMGSDKSAASSLSAAATATAAVSSRSGPKGDQQQARDQTGANGLVLRPEKHATIPLQSFNLDCGGGFVDSSSQPRQSVAYLRTLSAPAPTPQHHQQHHQHDNKASMAAGDCSRSLAAFNGEQHDHHRHHQQQQQQQQSSQQQHHQSLGNVQRTLTPEPTMTATTTILKIEEAAAAAAAAAAEAAAEAEVATGGQAQRLHKADEEWQRQRRQRQLENDMETIRNALLSQSQQLAAMEASNGGSDKNTLVASAGAAATATSIPKQERINQPAASVVSAAASSMSISPSSTLTTPSKPHGGSMTTGTTTTSYLLNGSDATKKGSTSTIWTSEESILRSVGAVDEDNNSTSSSACEEASGVLSSGKSGISLDSSGLDNDNNESGIGTATPPKDLPYWKSAHHHHHHDNESVNSLDALRKMKFQKSGSVASSDDPDLLEVLSLCDEPQGDDDHDNDVDVDVDDSLDADDIDDQHHRHSRHQSQQQQQTSASSSQQHQRRRRQLAGSNNKSNNNGDEEDDDVAVDDDATADLDDDEVDEGHDEFETVTYCDFTDGDASSASGVGASTATATAAGSSEAGAVLLRRKFNAAPPIMVPYGRAQKSRSHSLDTASLPSALPFNHHHQPHSHHLHHFHHPLPHPSQLARKLHHLQPSSRAKERGQLSLTLRQEPFQSLLSPTTHFQELPSPSSASLHSGHESLGIQELTTKSNSAPLLLKQERKRDDFAGQNLTLRYSRSQSDRYLAEIEAVEACKWLRAAGFPQYAQMYEDHQFPIDLTNVAKDHTNLENDQLQSLYRRLCILNRCANMRLDQSHKAQTPQKEESDDENFALSENWTFQPHIRRWSRIGEMGLELPPGGLLGAEKTESSSKESSPDRFEDDAYDVSGAGLTLTLPGQGGGGDSTDTTLNDSADASGVRLRRTGSERLKDGAKALLRRVESIKSRRRKRQNREGIVISGPQALDLSQLGQQRSSVRKPDAVYSTPPSPSAVSPMHSFPKSPFFGNELKVPSHSENFLSPNRASPNRASPKRTPTTPRSMRTSPLHFFSNPMPHLREGKSDDSSSYFSDSQESSAGGKLSFSLRKTPSKTRRFLQRTGKVDDIGAHSDSECHQGRKLLIKDANSNTTEVKIKKLSRGGSLNLGKDPKKRDGFRSSSFRSRSTTRKDVKTTDDADTVKRTPVVRWHSFQMEERPHMIFRKCFSQKIDPNAGDHGFPFAAMSAGQLQIIRKLALVILTGYMERYCPTHRSGWNWELPKFIKKIKMPDYKDKKVFGVPLLLVLQRTGQTLPVAVRSAFRWLQLNALDQIGLFRKSGVKSRIIKLKELIEYSETSAECMEVFDAQQAYDVADMLKQYFRDLPESLLTTKMSETFAAIFLHLPPDVRLDAVQCAVLLLPDENREILYALLEFLTLVSDNSQYNQMTANNLAVCLAPSLFHNSISTGASSVTASPRRRKGAGVPDVKELSEAKASHECLAFMIENYRKIYTATKEKINKCNFGYMEESKPVPLEALGEGMQFHNWRGYLYECTSATIKEGREKTRGWFTITSLSDPNVEIAYKKVGDGHPLRLWRCITEVEGPPKDVLEYVIRQRASWDASLLQSQTVKKLDERTDIFQYAVDGQITTDFCVLRSWQTDLPRGACVIVETSIEHAKAKPIYGSVRGVVLASRYLIEPCGSGRSRVMHLARVDIKGKTPEWYNKSYGHICSHHLSRIRAAFKNVADGPESKV